MRGSADFEALAVLLKRANNITKEFSGKPRGTAELRAALKEPAEVALAEEIDKRWQKTHDAIGHERYVEAMREVANLRQPVDRFFVDVLVMTDDVKLRTARLELLTILRDTIRQIADIAEIAPADRSG